MIKDSRIYVYCYCLPYRSTSSPLSIVNMNYHLLIITRSCHRSYPLKIFANSIRCQQDIKTHFPILLHSIHRLMLIINLWNGNHSSLGLFLASFHERRHVFFCCENRLPQFVLVFSCTIRFRLVMEGGRKKSILIYFEKLT